MTHLPASPAGENAEQRVRLVDERGKRKSFHLRAIAIGFAAALIAAGALHGLDRKSPCPEGAEQIGAAPPAGTLSYCRKIEDGKEILHGLYVEWYADRASWQGGHRVATRRLQGVYEDGERHGVWRWWRHNGAVKELVTYHRGVEHGKYETYDKEGRLTSRGYLDEGVRHGPYASFYPTGQEKLVGTYERGEKHGTWEGFWGDGKLRRKERFVNGVADGAFEARFVTGELEETGAHEMGRQAGEWVRYHAPGVLESRQRFEDGLPSGTWERFANDGTLLRQETWVAGALEGEVREWHPGGQLKVEGRYRAGFPAGVWRRFAEDGTELESVDHGEPEVDDGELVDVAARDIALQGG